MTIRNELFVKNFDSAGAIAPHRIVIAGSGDTDAAQADDATAYPLGISDSLGADAEGEPTDVIMAGIGALEYGATVDRSAPLKADAEGRGVPAAPGDYVVGYAAVAGVTGDIGACEINKALLGAEPA